MKNFKLGEGNKSVHFIGIGGISMSALAELLNHHGFKVSGSDAKNSAITDRLKSKGINIAIGHNKENIIGQDLIVYTDAIALDNEEFQEAIAQKLDIVDRASFLGMLMSEFKDSIAVSGTHGKTTTTSMITNVIYHHSTDPTILLGGMLDEIGGNIKIGQTDLLLTEACEYRANILKYFPSIAIILNIDEDHLDYFNNIEHITETFKGYMMNLHNDDKLIYNADDDRVCSILQFAKAKLISFGIERDADYMAKNISYDESGLASFDLYINGVSADRVKLSVMGYHNVQNALAAIAATHSYGVELKEILMGIEAYRGVHRRLEHKATINGVAIYDDYAHHPTEIQNSLHALKVRTKGRLICIFQPHTYTRTRILLDKFSHAFNEADEIIITDIYAAREKDYGDIHSRTLVDELKKQDIHARYMSGFAEVVEFLKGDVRENDIVVSMGAGDVYKVGESLIVELR